MFLCLAGHARTDTVFISFYCYMMHSFCLLPLFWMHYITAFAVYVYDDLLL